MTLATILSEINTLPSLALNLQYNLILLLLMRFSLSTDHRSSVSSRLSQNPDLSLILQIHICSKGVSRTADLHL